MNRSDFIPNSTWLGFVKIPAGMDCRDPEGPRFRIKLLNVRVFTDNEKQIGGATIMLNGVVFVISGPVAMLNCNEKLPEMMEYLAPITEAE